MCRFLLNTRPASANSFNIQAIDVIDLPLLEVYTFPTEKIYPDEVLAMQALMEGRVDLVVAVSTTAVKAAINFLATRGIFCAGDLPNLPVFVAIGKATWQALNDFGCHAITPALMSNEGMLDTPQIRALTHHQRVLIWRGVGGRRVLHHALTQRGITVQAVAWYERHTPKNLEQTFKQRVACLPKTAEIFVPITSEQSLNAWHTLSKSHRFIYLPLGKRLYDLTKALYPNAPMAMLDTLTDAHIWHIINTNF